MREGEQDVRVLVERAGVGRVEAELAGRDQGDAVDPEAREILRQCAGLVDDGLREVAGVRVAPEEPSAGLGPEQARGHLELAAEDDLAGVEIHRPRRVADHVIEVELLLGAEQRVPVEAHSSSSRAGGSTESTESVTSICASRP